jgi:hypothetical protein
LWKDCPVIEFTDQALAGTDSVTNGTEATLAQ